MWQIFKDLFIVFPKWVKRKFHVVLRANRTDGKHIEIINDCEVTLKDFRIEDRNESLFGNSMQIHIKCLDLKMLP